MSAFDQSDPPVTVASGPVSRPVDVTWAVHHDVPGPTDVRPAVRPGRQTTAQCGKSADRDESHWHRGTVTDSEPILLVVLELRLTQSDREHLRVCAPTQAIGDRLNLNLNTGRVVRVTRPGPSMQPRWLISRPAFQARARAPGAA
jgi:hypothetical protein